MGCVVSSDWGARFLRRHRDLFGGRGIRPSVGPGWQRLVEKSVSRIAEELRGRASGSLRIVEITEKLGGIRIDFAARNLPEAVLDAVHEAIDLAESRAECTCDVCGKAGGLRDLDGVFATRCEVHGEEHPIEPGGNRSRLLIKWTYRDGVRRVLSCRSYDRDLDAFIDASLPDEFSDAEED
jgi:hypothetical protein